jgi:hypothetical protein
VSIAQLVEYRSPKPRVVSSNLTGRAFVRVPEWFKGVVCKTIIQGFESPSELMKYQYNLELAIIQIDLKDYQYVCSILGIIDVYSCTSNTIIRLFDSKELLKIIKDLFDKKLNYSFKILGSFPVIINTENPLSTNEVTNSSCIKYHFNGLFITKDLFKLDYIDKHIYLTALNKDDWATVFDDLM